MQVVNESRAFYNTSFDVRMKKYATAWTLRANRKKKRITAQQFTMANEFALPSLESIVAANPNPHAALLNAELINYDDPLSEGEGEGATNNTEL